MSYIKRLYLSKSPRVFILMAFSVFWVTSCDLIGSSDTGNPPEIHSIRYFEPEMENAEREEISPGDRFVIHGRNLRTVRRVLINGVPVEFNPNLATDTDIILNTSRDDMQLGDLDPFSEDIGFITVHTRYGEARHPVNIAPGLPIIRRISHEYAQAGTTIRLTGLRLYLIYLVEFPGGVETTDFIFDKEGEWLDVVVPEGVTEGGPILVHGHGGTNNPGANPEFNSDRGMITNFDDIDIYLGGATGITDDPQLFPGIPNGRYAYMHIEDYESSTDPDDWGQVGNAIHLDTIQWFSPEQMLDPRSVSVRQYAIKFDINIPEAWDRGKILVLTGVNRDYALTYAPWDDRHNPGPYSTEGWETVELPLQVMRGDYGNGRIMRFINEFLGEDGKAPVSIIYVNDSGTRVNRLRFAIDNIRFVQTSGI